MTTHTMEESEIEEERLVPGVAAALEILLPLIRVVPAGDLLL